MSGNSSKDKKRELMRMCACIFFALFPILISAIYLRAPVEIVTPFVVFEGVLMIVVVSILAFK